ncbi:MAG: hypothetical protein KJO18_08855 [Acidimicrobiia bacterium]|nr:hypothetical protein [Acidimicrobiia bacterium]
MRHLGIAALAGILVLAACGAEPGNSAGETVSTVTTTVQETTIGSTNPPESVPPTSQPPSSTDTTPVTTVPPSSLVQGDVPAGMEMLVDLAVADLTEQLGVDASAVTVVSAAQVMWRDSSLGCPLPGFSYLQVLTEGGLVVLEVDGTEYEYHSGRENIPFLCEDPQPPLSGDNGTSDS